MILNIVYLPVHTKMGHTRDMVGIILRDKTKKSKEKDPIFTTSLFMNLMLIYAIFSLGRLLAI